ncbi:MAG: hypothetical protein ACRELD_15300 [Longimicrobiales bacterium]
MEHLIVVTYPEPLSIQARPMPHAVAKEGNVGLAYYYEDHVIARSVVDTDAMESISNLLRQPVLVALAAAEDDDGNIDARVCLVLPVEGEALKTEGDDEPDEPWRASIPEPPAEISTYGSGYDEQEERPKMALLPIGNVVRSLHDRNHPEDVAADASEMLRNLLTGRAKDAVQKAIDDLLGSL